jgi:hypothetical protein
MCSIKRLKFRTCTFSLYRLSASPKTIHRVFFLRKSIEFHACVKSHMLLVHGAQLVQTTRIESATKTAVMPICRCHKRSTRQIHHWLGP